MDHRPKDISNLVDRTVRMAVVRGEDIVYYEGKLDRRWGGYMISNPLVIYPDGREERKRGHKAVMERDFEEGRLEVVEQQRLVRNVY